METSDRLVGKDTVSEVAAQSIPSVEEVVRYYDWFTPLVRLVWSDNLHFGVWSGDYDRSTIEDATNRLVAMVVGRLTVGAQDRVLDVGCGVGKPARYLVSATGAHVVGVSSNRTQVYQALQCAAADGILGSMSFPCADAMEMPFRDGSFDAAIALESVIHMDRGRVFGEMFRVLRPGGRAVLTDMFEQSPDDPGGTGRSVREPQSAWLSPDKALRPRWSASPTWTWRPGPLPPAGSHRQLLTSAGFVVDEILDVSDEVRGSIPRLFEAVRTHGSAIRDRFGLGAEDIRRAFAAPPADLHRFGYLIANVHRPIGSP